MVSLQTSRIHAHDFISFYAYGAAAHQITCPVRRLSLSNDHSYPKPTAQCSSNECKLPTHSMSPALRKDVRSNLLNISSRHTPRHTPLLNITPPIPLILTNQHAPFPLPDTMFPLRPRLVIIQRLHIFHPLRATSRRHSWSLFLCPSGGCGIGDGRRRCVGGAVGVGACGTGGCVYGGWEVFYVGGGDESGV